MALTLPIMVSADASTFWDLIEVIPGDRIALIDPDASIRLSYDDLRAQVRTVANLMAGAGVARGVRVAMALANGIPAVACFLASALAGTATPLNPAYRRDEFQFFLGDTNASLFIIAGDSEAASEEARAAAEGRVRVATASLDADGRVIIAGLDRIGAAGRPAPDDIALVLHTSGSTGTPKRVPLTHRNLAFTSRSVAESYKLSDADVSLCVMPLFHVHGLVASMLATLITGGTVVIPHRFNPLTFWRTVRDNGVTWYSAVPTIHQMLLARADRPTKTARGPAVSSGLRFIRSCSARLAADHFHRMEEVFGVPVLQAYGMTEAAHQMSSNPMPPRARKADSVGIATGVEIAIMDADGKILASGEVGEVVIRGPGVMSGYENNPAANATAFVNGWFRTGDQGCLDEDGYLRLIGRLKELINRGGEKISPAEIDEVLLSHPAVAEAVAFGVEHPMWGEEVAAAVVLRAPATEKELIAYCRERIAEYKSPKKIHLVDAVPRTATGKIQRRAVAAAFADPKP